MYKKELLLSLGVAIYEPRSSPEYGCVQNCSALWLSASPLSDEASHNTAESHIHSCVQESHGVGNVNEIIGFVF